MNKNPDTFVRNPPVAKSAAPFMVILAAKGADVVKREACQFVSICFHGAEAVSVYRNVGIKTCTEHQGIQCLKSPDDANIVSTQWKEISDDGHKQHGECLREVAKGQFRRPNEESWLLTGTAASGKTRNLEHAPESSVSS